MDALTLDEFTRVAKQRGFEEVLVREWAPLVVSSEHKHPFDTDALMVRGEFWLTMDGSTRHIQVGETFQVPRDTLHAERYGSEGATFWAARLN
jgi:quercetin dioxygenase-like cupin family protein